MTQQVGNGSARGGKQLSLHSKYSDGRRYGSHENGQFSSPLCLLNRLVKSIQVHSFFSPQCRIPESQMSRLDLVARWVAPNAPNDAACSSYASLYRNLDAQFDCPGGHYYPSSYHVLPYEAFQVSVPSKFLPLPFAPVRLAPSW